MPEPARPRRATPGVSDPMARRSKRRRERREGREPAPSASPAGRTAPAAGSDPSTAGPASPAPGRRQRVVAAVLRPSRHQLVLGLVLGLVAMGVVMQLRAQGEQQGYTTARRSDLVQLLDGLSAETRRLEDELSSLEATRRELESGAGSERAAREEAARRRDELAVLAGTAPAEGPGIRLRITDPERKVGAQVMLNAVEELRDGGAEVIEVNDTIRVGASSWFADGPDGLLVDGQVVSTPITLEVVGDPVALEGAVRFRGGLVSQISGPQVGGDVRVTQSDLLEVDSVRAPRAFEHAEPVDRPR